MLLVLSFLVLQQHSQTAAWCCCCCLSSHTATFPDCCVMLLVLSFLVLQQLSQTAVWCCCCCLSSSYSNFPRLLRDVVAVVFPIPTATFPDCCLMLLLLFFLPLLVLLQLRSLFWNFPGLFIPQSSLSISVHLNASFHDLSCSPNLTLIITQIVIIYCFLYLHFCWNLVFTVSVMNLAAPEPANFRPETVGSCYDVEILNPYF